MGIGSSSFKSDNTVEMAKEAKEVSKERKGGVNFQRQEIRYIRKR